MNKRGKKNVFMVARAILAFAHFVNFVVRMVVLFLAITKVSRKAENNASDKLKQ